MKMSSVLHFFSPIYSDGRNPLIIVGDNGVSDIDD